MKTYIYLHICCINNWVQIVQDLLTQIKASGLYEKVDKIKCVLLTDTGVPDDIFRDKKIQLLGVYSNYHLYEQVTLHHLHEDALTEEFNVLYLHSKGVRHNDKNPCILDWVNLLSYFNIQKHEACLQGLVEYDAVGVNLETTPCLHYSGNFWWSKSSHIRTLPKCTYACYNSPEFWITSIQGKFLNVWSSGVNHYKERYPSSLYIL